MFSLVHLFNCFYFFFTKCFSVYFVNRLIWGWAWTFLAQLKLPFIIFLEFLLEQIPPVFFDVFILFSINVIHIFENMIRSFKFSSDRTIFAFVDCNNNVIKVWVNLFHDLLQISLCLIISPIYNLTFFFRFNMFFFSRFLIVWVFVYFKNFIALLPWRTTLETLFIE